MSRSSLPWLVVGAIAVAAALAWFTLTRGDGAPGASGNAQRYPLAPFHAGARALPDAPVAALCAAWRFLRQRAPDATPASAAQFWAYAREWWRPARLPPVALLPAPDAYNGSTSA